MVLNNEKFSVKKLRVKKAKYVSFIFWKQKQFCGQIFS